MSKTDTAAKANKLWLKLLNHMGITLVFYIPAVIIASVLADNSHLVLVYMLMFGAGYIRRKFD